MYDSWQVRTKSQFRWTCREEVQSQELDTKTGKIRQGNIGKGKEKGRRNLREKEKK